MSTTDDIRDRKLEDLRLILKDFLKVIKVVSMYPEDNPLPQSLKRTFAERLVDLVTDYGRLDFRVTKTEICLGDQTLFVDRSREESLAGLFFETGIIKISFKAGLEVDSVYQLLGAIKQYQNADRRTRDLAALLWESAIPNFGYETVEDVALRQYDTDFMIQNLEAGIGPAAQYQQMAGGEIQSYDDIFSREGDPAEGPEEGPVGTDGTFETSFLANDSGEVDTSALSSVLSTGDDERDATLQVTEAVEAMGLSDADTTPRLPDTNLILNDEMKLSEEELEQVDQLVTRDAEFVEYESTCELLKEILHQEAEMSHFYESVTICEKVLTEFVAAGRLTFAADLLRYFAALEERLKTEQPLWGERLKEARVTAGSRERLATLCRALNDNDEIGTLEVRRYLDNFNWEALMGITDMLGDLEHEHHRNGVRDYLTERGRERVHIVARGVHDKRPEVVAATASILANIGSPQALQQLAKVVEHSEPLVRRTLAAELSTCPSDDCLPLLRQLAQDEDRTVRQDAVKAIVARRGQPAFDTITELINDDRFYKLDSDDQRAILIAYSKLGGDLAVDFLVRLADKVNLFKNSHVSFYREAAFEALSYNRGDKAERILLKMSGSWRGELKALAKAAMQKRRELIYGGTDE
jgi:HEAT repeat protein